MTRQTVKQQTTTRTTTTTKRTRKSGSANASPRRTPTIDLAYLDRLLRQRVADGSLSASAYAFIRAHGYLPLDWPEHEERPALGMSLDALTRLAEEVCAQASTTGPAAA